MTTSGQVRLQRKQLCTHSDSEQEHRKAQRARMPRKRPQALPLLEPAKVDVALAKVDVRSELRVLKRSTQMDAQAVLGLVGLQERGLRRHELGNKLSVRAHEL